MSQKEEMLEVKKIIKSGNKQQISEAIRNYCKKYLHQHFKPSNPTEVFNGEVETKGLEVIPNVFTNQKTNGSIQTWNTSIN